MFVSASWRLSTTVFCFTGRAASTLGGISSVDAGSGAVLGTLERGGSENFCTGGADGVERACPNPPQHFLCTTLGPDSSYSSFVIHICWKVLRDAKMEPPIHDEYFRSGGAVTLTFIVLGARLWISFCNRWPMPEKQEEPPARTTLLYRSLRMSTSQDIMARNTISWIPSCSLPHMQGENNNSATRNRSLPTVIVCPSGSS
mmetsp:Transcript_129523/g.223723  ORF Transcript_129523/g.223723 Transcript_129523/m.223723 type:complete len:201 (-) Transcript_129523:399-1001(-)